MGTGAGGDRRRGRLQRRLGQALARTAPEGLPRGPRAAGVLTGRTAFRCTCLRRDAQVQARQERWAKGRGDSGERRWLGAGCDGGRRTFGGAEWDPQTFSGSFAASGGSTWGRGASQGAGALLGQGSGDRVAGSSVLPRPAGPGNGFRAPSCARSLPGPPFPPQPTSLRCPRCRHPGRLSLPSARTCSRTWFCGPACLRPSLPTADALPCRFIRHLLSEHPDHGALSPRLFGTFTQQIFRGLAGGYSKEGLEPSLSLTL